MSENSSENAPREAGPRVRVRRRPEEARRQILEAAERRLRSGGPEAIRLQDIARDAGMSHPTILHHFRSRDGLIEALAERVTQRLADDLLAVLRDAPPTEASALEIVERIFAALADTGHARLLAWRALCGPPRTGETRALIGRIVEAVHAHRIELARARGTPEPSREDSAYAVRLAASAMLGDAISGELFSPERGADERTGAPCEADLRFRRWLGRLLVEHLERA